MPDQPPVVRIRRKKNFAEHSLQHKIYAYRFQKKLGSDMSLLLQSRPTALYHYIKINPLPKSKEKER
jgi:hypothetical protein